MRLRSVAEILASIQKNEFVHTFARSQGPGGQNVNKVNTKASIRLPRRAFHKVSWISPETRSSILANGFKYLTKSGDVLVTSELTRSQQTNLETCYLNLAKAVQSVDKQVIKVEPSSETKAKWRAVQKRSKLVNMKTKKLHSAKKEDRRC